MINITFLEKSVNKTAALISNQSCVSSDYLNTRDEMKRIFHEVENAMKEKGLSRDERAVLNRLHTNLCYGLADIKFNVRLASLAFDILNIAPNGNDEYSYENHIFKAGGWISAVDKALDIMHIKDKNSYLQGLIVPSRYGLNIKQFYDRVGIDERKAKKIAVRNPKQFYCLILAAKNYQEFNESYKTLNIIFLSKMTGLKENAIKKNIDSSRLIEKMTFFGASLRAGNVSGTQRLKR